MPLFNPNVPDIPEIKTYANVAALDSIITPEIGTLTVPNMQTAFPTLPTDAIGNRQASILVTTSVQDTPGNNAYSIVTQMFPLTGEHMKPGFAMRIGSMLDGTLPVTWNSWTRTSISNMMWHWDNGDAAGTTLTLDPSIVMDNRIIVRRGGILTFSPKKQVYVRDPIWVYNEGPSNLRIDHHEGTMRNGYVPPGSFVRIDYALGSLGPQVENYASWITHMGNPASWKPGMEVYSDPTFTAAEAGTIPYVNRATQTITLADLGTLGATQAPIHLRLDPLQTVTLVSPVTIAGPTTLSGGISGRVIDIFWYSGKWYVDDPAEPPVDFHPRIIGKYYSTTHPVNQGDVDANVFGTSGQMVFMLPFAVTGPLRLDALSAYIATAGEAGSLIRLGVYRHDPEFTKFTKLVSVSSSASSTGDKISTISLRLSPAMYWLAYGCTDTSGNMITTRISKDGRHAGFNGNSNPQYQVTEFAPCWDGVDLSSDLPATLDVSAIAQWMENDIPVVWARRGAM